LNLSVLDGWWDEAYTPEVGWRIGNGEEYDDLDYQDEIESRMIYESLEKEIIPLFYSRGENNLPRNWISMMKNSMKQLGPVYNTHRMLEEYFDKFYNNAYQKRINLSEKEWKKAKEYSAWKGRLLANWSKVKFVSHSELNKNEGLKVGAKYSVQAEVEMGDLTPDDVDVQVYFGKIEDKNRSTMNAFVNMKCVNNKNTGSVYKYKGEIDCLDTGHFGFTLRVLPKHSMMVNQFELGLIKWA
jgi:starch phosphorylase